MLDRMCLPSLFPSEELRIRATKRDSTPRHGCRRRGFGQPGGGKVLEKVRRREKVNGMACVRNTDVNHGVSEPRP